MRKVFLEIHKNQGFERNNIGIDGMDMAAMAIAEWGTHVGCPMIMVSVHGD
ncbi:hypothetical protein N9954_00410 [Maribacter sp.]|nr:hypothetical protein [Maribacter sp.]